MLSQAGKLRLAAARGDVGQVGELIRAKVPVTPDQHSITAAACGHTQIVKMILDNQLSPVNQTDAGGKTALHLAAAAGHMQCTQGAAVRGSSPALPNTYGDSPLHTTACRYGHAGVSRILLSAHPLTPGEHAEQERRHRTAYW
uniref:ANK_REP_REGION domain-containing protein n=1 Tax=Macrostomum lignano TaxID=282301 RepID=A0A1I8F787_9PLAT